MSLGPDCGVKYRIDEQALPWNKGGPSEFFDWLLSNLDSVAAVLNCSDPETFFDVARWSLVRITETESPSYEFVHEPTGIRSLHDARAREHESADAARVVVATRYVRRFYRLRELLEAPRLICFVHVVDNENEMNLQPPPSRDVILRVRGLLPTRHRMVIVHDGDFADSAELAVAGVAFIDTRRYRLQTRKLGSEQGELPREPNEPGGWRRDHLDWKRLLLAVSDAQPSRDLKEPPWRCEFEAHPADGDVSPEDMYRAAAAISLPGVSWWGWRTEPLFFGIEKLIVIVRLSDIDGGSADDVLACLQGLETVQSAKLLSATQGADPFALCSRLFDLQIESICDGYLDLPCLGVEAAAALVRHGWTTIDDWMPPDACGKVARIIAASMTARSEGRSDGVEWREPEPRSARSDVATWLKAGQRPASDQEFAEELLPKFDALAADLRVLMPGIAGVISELQLACYPADQHARYHRHTDANADSRPMSGERKVTCILYLNPAWVEASAGCLRLTRADHEMGTAGGTVDIEPIGGRLLCFLSGAMAHEVLPTKDDRFAVTAWVA